MNLPSFLTMLFENGCVQVPPAGQMTADELDEAQRVLIEFEREYRVSLADAPPAFDAKIGCQAAVALYRICQCLVYRELNPQEVLFEPQSDYPAAIAAAAHYSADLALGFLPDAFSFAVFVTRASASTPERTPLPDRPKRAFPDAPWRIF